VLLCRWVMCLVYFLPPSRPIAPTNVGAGQGLLYRRRSRPGHPTRGPGLSVVLLLLSALEHAITYSATPPPTSYSHSLALWDQTLWPSPPGPQLGRQRWGWGCLYRISLVLVGLPVFFLPETRGLLNFSFFLAFFYESSIYWVNRRVTLIPLA
jgi:hypothetical protein